MFHVTKRVRATSILSALLLLGAQLSPSFTVLVPHAAADSYVVNGSITICHRTDSYSNPYVQITVDQSAADGIAGNSGNVADHYGEHQGPVFYATIPKHTEWGDIIPPIPGTPDENGLNWTTDGQAIWNNGCNIPESGAVTVDKCVDTTGTDQYTCDNVLANSLGFQWSFDTATPSWNDMGATVGGVTAGDQSVIENQVSGYTFTGWYETGNQNYSCADPEGTTQPIDITVKESQTTEITLCNQADPNGSITLIKNVIEDNGGTASVNDFGLTIGGTPVTSGQALSLPAGDYTVNEAGKAGYSFVSLTGTDCPTQLGGTVSLAYGQNVTCTITNDDDTPSLTLVKKVINDNGGTAVASDWTLSANGPTPISGAGGAVSGSSFQAGTYTLSENGGPSGYTASAWSCVGGTQSGDSITLALGDNATCTITNDDMPASLTVVKIAFPSTTQSFGFTSPELGKFSLTGDNGANSSQTFDNLNSGTYSFSEQSIDNWQTSYLRCDNSVYNVSSSAMSVTLENGSEATCYVENLELGTIEGHKFNDVNDNHVWDSGEPTLKDWTITLTGCVENEDDVVSIITNTQTCANPVSRTTTTDAGGAYSFTDLEPGAYTVCEVQQPTWIQTYPQTNNGCHVVTINIEDYGQVVTADFGNHPNPQVLGSSTTVRTLVVTGANASVNLIVGITLLGAVVTLHFVGRRQHN